LSIKPQTIVAMGSATPTGSKNNVRIGPIKREVRC
jgi:hypothetical protein